MLLAQTCLPYQSRILQEVFNISTGEATTINTLVKTIQEIMGKTVVEPVYKDPRPGDIKHSYADISKARKNLEYKPRVQLEEGLTELIEWYTKH